MGNFKPRHAFALSPPGRWRFLTHLLDQARYFGVRMTWRHKIVFYANAVGALFVGYRNFARLDEWRRRQALPGFIASPQPS